MVQLGCRLDRFFVLVGVFLGIFFGDDVVGLFLGIVQLAQGLLGVTQFFALFDTGCAIFGLLDDVLEEDAVVAPAVVDFVKLSNGLSWVTRRAIKRGLATLHIQDIADFPQFPFDFDLPHARTIIQSRALRVLGLILQNIHNLLELYLLLPIALLRSVSHTLFIVLAALEEASCAVVARAVFGLALQVVEGAELDGHCLEGLIV